MRDAQKDYQYLCGADAHRDEGGTLGEACARGLLDIALYWVDRQRIRYMDDPELEKIKADGTFIMVCVPKKSIPAGATYRLELPARWAFVHWSHPIDMTPAVQPSLHSVELENKHGGFWASDKRGIKPLKGAPVAWLPIPDLPEGIRK